MTKSLCELKVGEKAKISKIDADTHLKRRLFEFGILPDETVNVLSISPLKNSFLVAIKNYTLALRRDILQNISVEIYG